MACPQRTFWSKNWDRRFLTTTTTWKQILQCVHALSTESKEDVIFRPLHRREGGFECTSLFGDRQGCSSIRFKCENREDFVKRWPSQYHNFDTAMDDLTVFEGGDYVTLTCQGVDCPPWTRQMCRGYDKIIARELGWYRFRSKKELGECQKEEEKWLHINRLSLKRKRLSAADVCYDLCQ